MNNFVHNLPPQIKPCLRLFLSVDIVGSTAFKQSGKSNKDSSESKSKRVPAWLIATTTFYSEIERLFKLKWESHSYSLDKKYSWPMGEKPSLWKAAGDELIYTSVLTDHKQALVCITAWIDTVNAFRPELKRFSQSLDLKSTAWISGFPVLNTELILKAADKKFTREIYFDDPVLANFQLLEEYLSSADGLIKDYIGPSIDIAFRLAAFSSPRKFVVSLDLALLLSHALVTPPEPNFDLANIEFHFDGKHPLKGVLNGVPYPIFWIDHFVNKSKLYELEDRFTGSQPIGFSEIREYCLHFIDGLDSDRLIQPYICSDTDRFFHKMPEQHNAQLEMYVEYIKNETNNRIIESDPSKVPENYPAQTSSPVDTHEILKKLGIALKQGSSQATKV